MVDDRPSQDRWADPATRAEDFDRPSSARVYDYLLGGASHGAVDRALGDELRAAEPRIVSVVRENRSFLRRAVKALVADGIDQFLDLGSGIPTMGNVHEIAHRTDPTARVAYVDLDPVAVAHGERLLTTVDGVTSTRADLRDPVAVLAAPGVAGLLDLSRPVGLLMFSVLQHIPDADDPTALVERYLSWLAPGSALALSHVSADDTRLAMPAVEALTGSYSRGGVTARSRPEVTRMLAGVDLLEPGVVWASQWRPDRVAPADETACGHWAGVGVRRSGGHCAPGGVRH